MDRYAVKFTRSGEVVESGFESKRAAKELRDKLNKEIHGDDFPKDVEKTYAVCRGKDNGYYIGLDR